MTGLAWSPDEKHLAYALHRLNGSGQAEIHLLTVAEDDGSVSPEEIGSFRDNNVTDPYFTPDSQWITYSYFDYDSADTNGRGIWMTSLDGKIRRKLISDAEQPAW